MVRKQGVKPQEKTAAKRDGAPMASRESATTAESRGTALSGARREKAGPVER